MIIRMIGVAAAMLLLAACSSAPPPANGERPGAARRRRAAPARYAPGSPAGISRGDGRRSRVLLPMTSPTISSEGQQDPAAPVPMAEALCAGLDHDRGALRRAARHARIQPRAFGERVRATAGQECPRRAGHPGGAHPDDQPLWQGAGKQADRRRIGRGRLRAEPRRYHDRQRRLRPAFEISRASSAFAARRPRFAQNEHYLGTGGRASNLLASGMRRSCAAPVRRSRRLGRLRMMRGLA